MYQKYNESRQGRLKPCLIVTYVVSFMWYLPPPADDPQSRTKLRGIAGKTPGNTSLFSMLQCSAHGPYIQKHLLWAVLCGPFNRNEPITCVPSGFVAVRIRYDAATADVLRNPQIGLECFGD